MWRFLSNLSIAKPICILWVERSGSYKGGLLLMKAKTGAFRKKTKMMKQLEAWKQADAKEINTIGFGQSTVKHCSASPRLAREEWCTSAPSAALAPRRSLTLLLTGSSGKISDLFAFNVTDLRLIQSPSSFFKGLYPFQTFSTEIFPEAYVN